jgi:hypothetical protein
MHNLPLLCIKHTRFKVSTDCCAGTTSCTCQHCLTGTPGKVHLLLTKLMLSWPRNKSSREVNRCRQVVLMCRVRGGVGRRDYGVGDTDVGYAVGWQMSP